MKNEAINDDDWVVRRIPPEWVQDANLGHEHRYRPSSAAFSDSTRPPSDMSGYSRYLIISSGMDILDVLQSYPDFGCVALRVYELRNCEHLKLEVYHMPDEADAVVGFAHVQVRGEKKKKVKKAISRLAKWIRMPVGYDGPVFDFEKNAYPSE